jgi:hypothetical protein
MCVFCVLFAGIVGVLVLFLLSFAYDIFSLPSVFWHAAGILFSCLRILV